MVTIRVEMDMSIKVLIMMIGDLFIRVTLVVAYAYNGMDVNADVHEGNRCTHHRCIASSSVRSTAPHAARLNKRSASNPSSNNSTTGRATRKRDSGSGGDTKAPTTTQPNHTCRR